MTENTSEQVEQVEQVEQAEQAEQAVAPQDKDARANRKVRTGVVTSDSVR